MSDFFFSSSLLLKASGRSRKTDYAQISDVRKVINCTEKRRDFTANKLHLFQTLVLLLLHQF